MNPNQQSLNLYEQKLRDEVIYLHSLWHQGPPTLNRNPHHHQPSHFLHVSNPTPFKRTTKTKKTNSKNKNFAMFSGPSALDPLPDRDPEWPVNSPQSSAHTISGWPVFEANSGSLAKPVSDIEIVELGKKQMQMKVAKACNEFFTKLVGFDDDDDDDDDVAHERDEVMEESVEESEVFKFLLNLFVENEELRKLYEDETESGHFYCLVCRGVGEKLGKKYKGCLSLLQHAVAISKTRRRRTHRAFGFVICRVVGWDFDRLPVVVIKGECLSRSLLNSQNFLYKENEEVNKDLGNGENDRGATQQEEKEEAIDCLGPESSLISDAQSSQQEPPDMSHVTTPGSPPPFEPQTILTRCSIPSEELAKFSIVQLQQKFVEECKKLLANPSGSNCDEVDDDDGDKDDLNDEQIEECEEFKSLMRLFSENSELRNFYENHHEGEEFCCLICCSIGKKVWERFNGCGGLLQHVTAITRTKLKRAHRALGLVICKVLSWDVAKFQTIGLKEEALGQSLNDASFLQDEQTNNNICNDEG